MNNHSFRTSITVLTVATIVGCGVMLLSGFSQFRLRPVANEKALASAANQKLRNRFGEFYPVEQRVPSTTTSSPSTGPFQNVSQSSTFEEVVTTTSEYDNTEVITSWSPGTPSGVPQVSVPVTINVNNGELMAQLIETRESLAEVKAQQSAIRQDQRVFSYQVHKDDSGAVKNSGNASATTEPPSVAVESSGSKSSVERTSNTSKLQAVSQHNDRASISRQAVSTEKTQQSSEFHSASREVIGRSTVRMRSISEAGSVHTATERSSRALQSSRATPALESERTSETGVVTSSVQTPEESHEPEFEAVQEKSSGTEIPDVSIEEEISFEAIPQSTAPSVEEDAATVPVIEPISYQVEEISEESRSVSITEDPVLEFGSLEKSAAIEAPASLPELSFEEPKLKEDGEFPVLSLDATTKDNEFINSGAAESSDNSSQEPELPEFFAAEENEASTPTTAVDDKPASSAAPRKPGRTREQLASAFAAVRGLPPEDLFGDRSTPFVAPIEPAEPIGQESVPEFAFADSTSKAEGDTSESISETSAPTISFGSSAGHNLVVHPSSAASPVELEFGEPSVTDPALAHSETPGVPETPAMLPAEEKPERWHKYRSRIHLRQNSAPSTPVPPVPKLASTSVPESPSSSFQEPALVPPVADGLPEMLLSEAKSDFPESDRTISDSPLMIPDADGTTEVAQNSGSDKLASADLPPVPELTAVPELAPVPELQFPLNTLPADSNIVYEPQPVMDRLNEVTAEMSGTPIVSAIPPVMTQRSMPSKSANKVPFETTFRRINKRVAWMADALSPPEKATAQQKPMRPKSPAMGRPKSSPHPPTQRHGQAVAKKNAPPMQMQLPKLTLPKFTVQNFAMPNVNFRAIQAPAFQMPTLDTPDWLACPPDVMAPVRNSTAVHRVISTMQFVGQPKTLN